MQILDNLIILSLIVGAFFAGMYISSRFNMKSAIEVKDALEKQYLRLRAKADADDPCRPYVAPRVLQSMPRPVATGDYDGDEELRPITPAFMDHLKANGKAATKFCKSDIAK
jgi:hypothetical protein